MSIADDLKQSITRLANDVGALVNRILHLERHLGYLMKMNVVRSDKDANGIYRKLTYTRPNGTLFQTALLENDPLIQSTGYYNKRVISIYNKAGDTIVEQWSVEIQYDSDGVVVSETIL